MDKELDKLVDADIEAAAEELVLSAKNMPRCWYCESPFVREGVCDDCGKHQYNIDEEMENEEEFCCEECQKQAAYFN